MKGKILVTARSFRATAGPHQQTLLDAGYEIVNSPYERPLEAHELAALITDVVGAILGLDEVTADVIAQATRLRVISRYGVGVDSIDLKAATEHGVVVTTTPGANSVAVAELTMGLLLALARHIPYHDRAVKEGGWKRAQGIELAGLTLGVVGLGQIGQLVARLATGFGMRVLYYDPFPPAQEVVDALGVSSRSLEALLAESDVISLHLPLTDATRNLIDQAALGLMKPSALLINTARGGIVDEQALYEALSAGRLAGAACDVFLKEPPGENPLLSLDNFIASPHAGSATRQTTLRMGMMASQNALAVLQGRRPAHVANPEVYARGLLKA